MDLKPNKLRAKLANDEVVYGTCMCAYSPNLVELAGFLGYDFCRIDNEHAWRQDDMMEHMIRAAVISDITPLVRVDKGNPYLIRKVLEIGAGGIIIPNIYNSAEVEEVVRAAKFPPYGDRGFSGLCFSAGYGTVPADEWREWSNREPMVGIMIEKKEAVDNIEEIMAVEGLDFVMFGPADYSISIGLDKPNKNHPDVQSAIRRTAEAARKNGKSIIVPIGEPWDEEARKYTDIGVNMIEMGHDYSMLNRAWSKALKSVKK
ncbi:MAG: HpcH/HpaI aldolase family protein [Halanaerobiales bacterium]